MLPTPSSTLTALPPYVFAQLDVIKTEARARGAQFVDLGIGNPDAPIPEPILAALGDAIHDPATHGYPPFRGAPRFLEAAARFMHARFGVTVDPERNVLALSGSKEGLIQLSIAFCALGSVALVPDIYYPVHARSALLNGGDVYYLPATAASGFLPRLDHVPPSVLKRAKILIVNYPNNPTGAVATKAFYERAVAFARAHDLVLVSDLAYSELTYDGFVAPSVFEVEGAMDVAVEFHSCSKTFNMAGMRIGFAVGNADVIDTIAAYRSNVGYGTPTAIQYAAAFALDHYRELGGAVCDRYQRRRDAAVNAFRSIGWTVDAPKATMYIWLPVPAGFSEWEWTHALLERAQVVVTPGIAFGPGGTGYFRVSLVADEAVLAPAIERIANVHVPARAAGRAEALDGQPAGR